MGKLKSTPLETKYKAVLSQERRWAGAATRAVIKPKALSVWEIMMPIIFIMNYAKSKSERELFAQNFLFTKELALKAARDMVRNGSGKGNVMSPIEEKTKALLSSVEDGLYSEEIRSKQLEEIDLLIDHYHRLLVADGGDYNSLIINAYGNQGNYREFLAVLKEAEKKVNLAAINTLGSRANMERVSNIEEALDKARAFSAEKIFNKN